MRCLMGLYNNGVKKYSLGKTTNRLSTYMCVCFPEQPLKAVVACDCRHSNASLVAVRDPKLNFMLAYILA